MFRLMVIFCVNGSCTSQVIEYPSKEAQMAAKKAIKEQSDCPVILLD